MKKTFRTIFIIIAVIFVGIQFVPVERTNPPAPGELDASPEVKEILVRSCYDCHSYHTKWPFYAYIAPLSWRISEDVVEGRRHLNFSTWATLKREAKRHTLEEIIEEIEQDKMPLPEYLRMHKDANVSEVDLIVLREWVEEELLKGQY